VNTDQQNKSPVADEALPEGYKESSWPQRGRLVFGPWCLLGAWPAVFGVVEKSEEQQQEKE
jgi:hypothetical protein